VKVESATGDLFRAEGIEGLGIDDVKVMTGTGRGVT